MRRFGASACLALAAGLGALLYGPVNAGAITVLVFCGVALALRELGDRRS